MPSGRVAELFLEGAAKLERYDRFVCFLAGSYASDGREVDALSPVFTVANPGYLERGAMTVEPPFPPP